MISSNFIVDFCFFCFFFKFWASACETSSRDFSLILCVIWSRRLRKRFVRLLYFVSWISWFGVDDMWWERGRERNLFIFKFISRFFSFFFFFLGFFFLYYILRSTCRMLFGPRLPDVGIPWTDRIVIIFFFFSFFFSIVALRCHFNSHTRNNKINNTTTTTASSSYYSTKERIFDSIFKFLSSEMAGVDILSFRFIAQQTSICSAWCVNACAIFFSIIRRGLLSIQ